MPRYLFLYCKISFIIGKDLFYYGTASCLGEHMGADVSKGLYNYHGKVLSFNR